MDNASNRPISLLKKLATALAPLVLAGVIPAVQSYSSYIKLTYQSDVYLVLDIAVPLVFAALLVSTMLLILAMSKRTAIILSALCAFECAVCILLCGSFIFGPFLIHQLEGLLEFDLSLAACASYALLALYCAVSRKRIEATPDHVR